MGDPPRPSTKSENGGLVMDNTAFECVIKKRAGDVSTVELVPGAHSWGPRRPLLSAPEIVKAELTIAPIMILVSYRLRAFE